MVTQLFDIDAIELGDGAVIGGIENQGFNFNNELDNAPNSGRATSVFQSLLAQNPSGSMSTLHIADALDVIGLTGVKISDLTGGVRIYGKKRELGGVRASGSVNLKYTINEGMVIPRRLSANHQGNAMLGIDIIPLYDGSNDPVEKEESQAAPTNPSAGFRWTIGAMTLGGVTIDHITDWELDFGLQVTPVGADSDIWPTFISVDSQLPVLTVNGINPDWFKDSGGIPLEGINGTVSDIIWYLRQRADGGKFTSDATLEHIKFTGNGMVLIDTPFDGNSNEAMSVSASCTFRETLSNAPIIVDTASGIT